MILGLVLALIVFLLSLSLLLLQLLLFLPLLPQSPLLRLFLLLHRFHLVQLFVQLLFPVTLRLHALPREHAILRSVKLLKHGFRLKLSVVDVILKRPALSLARPALLRPFAFTEVTRVARRSTSARRTRGDHHRLPRVQPRSPHQSAAVALPTPQQTCTVTRAAIVLEKMRLQLLYALKHVEPKTSLRSVVDA